MQRGRCTNFGGCGLAANRKTIPIAPGQRAICPECGQPLMLMQGGNAMGALFGLALLILLVVGGFFFLRARNMSGEPARELSGVPITANPPQRDTAPQDGVQEMQPTGGAASADAATPPVLKSNLHFYFEKSGKSWIAEALEPVNARGGGRIAYDSKGSREAMQEILFRQYAENDDAAPALWNPADIYWIRKANKAWRSGDGKSLPRHDADRLGEPAMLLSTRLVFVMWNGRAAAFRRAMATPRYRGRTWLLLHDLTTNGWASIGGDASWGTLKMAQTDPLKSNSGMISLGLMFDEWRKGAEQGKAVTPSDGRFVRWMRDIEGAVVGGDFAETTSDTLKMFQNGGSSAYDMAIAYEQNALQLADSTQGFEIVYPEPTANVRFPIAAVQTGNRDRQEDAQRVIAYLLSEPLQRRAPAFGFRPGLTGVSFDSLNSTARRKRGFQMTPAAAASIATTDEFDTLQDVWKRYFRPGL